MAIYNEILVGRYAAQIKKLFGMKGQNPTKQLAGEVSVALPLFLGAEGRFLEGWDRFGFGINTAATAAQTNGIEISNPKGSNAIAVIEKMTIFSGALQIVQLSNGSEAELTAPAPGVPWDGRSQRLSTILVSSSVATPPNLGNSLGGIAVQANIPYDFILTDIQEFPLVPNSSLRIVAAAVNTQLQMFFMWRERFLEESERQ